MNIPPVIHDYFEAIRRKDRVAWLATFSDGPGLLQVDPVGTPGRTSKEEIGAFWDQIHGLFAQVELTVRHTYPGGPDGLALVWQGKGTGHNGIHVEFEGIDVFRLDGSGKVLSVEAYWDANATLSRLMP